MIDDSRASEKPNPAPAALKWPLLAAACAGHYASIVVRGAPAAVAIDLQRRFQLEDFLFGLLSGPAYIVVNIAALLAFAAVIDRIDRVRAMAGCLLLWSAGSALFALAPNVETLFAGRILVGLGQAAFAPCAASLIIDRCGQAFGRPLSAFTASSALGRSTGLMLAGGLLALAAWPVMRTTTLEPWRLACLGLTAPGLVLGLILAGRREPPRTATPGVRLEQVAAAAWRRRRALAPLLTAGCAVILLTHAATTWLPSVLARGFDLPGSRAAVLAGGAVLAGAPLGHLMGGLLLDRRTAAGPPLYLIALSLAVCAVSGAGLAIAPALPLAWLAGAVLSAGLAVGALAALAALQPLTAPHHRGKATTLYFAAVNLVGMSLGPPLVGLVSDLGAAGGLKTAVGLVIVATSLCGAAVAGLGAGLRPRRPASPCPARSDSGRRTSPSAHRPR